GISTRLFLLSRASGMPPLTPKAWLLSLRAATRRSGALHRRHLARTRSEGGVTTSHFKGMAGIGLNTEGTTAVVPAPGRPHAFSESSQIFFRIVQHFAFTFVVMSEPDEKRTPPPNEDALPAVPGSAAVVPMAAVGTRMALC